MALLGAILTPILSLISIILVVLIVIAGSHPNLLTDFYFLKTSISDFEIPSKLANATLLKDLSELTGTDWVGQSTSKQSLKLDDEYTVGLLAACGHGNDTKCSSPSIGFHFNPVTDLKLEHTALQGSYPSGLMSALSSYKSVSNYLGAGYIAAAALIFVALILMLFSKKRPIIATLGAGASFVASILLLAASITAPVTFSKLASQLNSAFKQSGIDSSWGSKPVIVSFVATFIALTASLVHIARARSTFKTRRTRNGGGGVSKLKLSTRDVEPVRGPATASRRTPFSAVLNRIPTFGATRYTRVERQPQVVAVGPSISRRGSNEDDRELLFSADNMHGNVIHEGHEDEDYQHPQGYTHGGPGGLGMQTGPSRATRDINLAYEPFSRGT